MRTDFIAPHMREALKNHILIPESDSPTLKSFYLKKPGDGRMMSTLIVFTVEGIVLLGDLTPCQNGVISCYGYGSGWFSGSKSQHYLCEKFLPKVFRPDLAVEEFKDRLVSRRREEGPDFPFDTRKHRLTKRGAREAWDQIESMADELHGHAYYELYSETFDDSPEGCYDYDLGDGGWLCAIHEKFVEEYAKIAIGHVAQEEGVA